MRTERVTFLTSAEQKAALDAFAATNGLSVGHVVREATVRYLAEGEMGEEQRLALLVDQLDQAMPRIHAALDRTVARLDAANGDLQRMRREAGFAE